MKIIPKHIVITGASSGIGEGLAMTYAARGIMLSLTGRDEERLKNVVLACTKRGAIVNSVIVDVRDQAEMARVMLLFDQKQPIDLVIANAGISAGTGGAHAGESAEQVRQIFDVNLTGTLNTIDPILPKMIERGGGQVALMSSMAGFIGLPGSPAYCASKAAVRIYGESLRGSLFRAGICINVICPGFVRSRITDVNQFKMPLIMPAMRAGKIIALGLQKNKKLIVFPLIMYLFIRFMLIFPSFLFEFILRAMPSKTQKS